MSRPGTSAAFFRLHYSDDFISFPEGTYCDITTEVNDAQEKPSIVLQPNPGTDELRLNGLPDQGALVLVRDALGRIVLPAQWFVNGAALSTTMLSPGTVLVEVTGSDGARQILRWVKE